MSNSVILKGNRYGISIVLKKETEFEKILEDLAYRLENASQFFDCSKQLAVSFEGRNISNEELEQLLNVIEKKSKLNIQYVLDENSDLEATFFDIIHSEDDPPAVSDTKDSFMNTPNVHETEHMSGKDEKVDYKQDGAAMFYKGTLRSGQALEAKESLIVIGDVNPGASVFAGKNIIVIGALKGSVRAGALGDKESFVMALAMNPIQIQIADVIARKEDGKSFGKNHKDAMIAKIENNQIVMDMVSKSTIFDMKY